MECPQCFYAKDAAVDEKRCRICGRSYRPSVNVYLGLVAILYLVFVRYFATTLTGAPLSDVKVRPPSSLTSAFLAIWAREPVDIQFRPELILILGGMLALLVLVPVAMSILYGKRGGFLLATVALLLGPSFWLALPLFLSVWIAGGWTLRMTSKIASAILACAPMWIFYLLYSRAPSRLPLPSSYYMPALAAMALSAALIIVLFLALRPLKWNARWAGIALCILCALPIAAYKLVVGEDEIAYFRLAHEYGLESARFEGESGAKIVERLEEDDRRQEEKEKAEKATRTPARSDVIPPAPEDERQIRQGKRNIRKLQMAVELEQKTAMLKKETVEQCRAFLADYPDSRHKVDVIYTMIWASDMKVDTSALRQQDPANLPIRFDSSRIHGLGDGQGGQAELADSRQLCQELLRDYPDSPYAIAARVKLADDQARSGDIAGAVARYDQVLARYGPQVDARLEGLENLSLLANLLDVGQRRRDEARQQLVDTWFRIAERDQAFLVENSDCPRCGNAQLMAYLAIPLFQAASIKEDDLKKILAACPDCKLADNVAYELALLQAGVQKRMAALEDVPRRYAGTDGAAQALYALADIEQMLEGNRIENMQRAMTHYRQIERDYPKSYLARLVGLKIRELDLALRKALSAARPEGPGR